MNIFEFDKYTQFLHKWIVAQPSRGRGLARQMARFLNVHPTLISQVLLSKRDLTLEQAYALLKFLKLELDSAEYFILMVEFARAGTIELRNFKKEKMLLLRKKNQDIQNIIQQTQLIEEKHQAQYYSRWEYGAIRLLTYSKDCKTPSQIAHRLGLSEPQTSKLINFLINSGLLTSKNNQLSATTLSTFVGKGSVHRNQHYKNWRALAEKHQALHSDDEIHFTAPVMLSKSDAEKFKTRLIDLIQEFSKLTDASPSEDLYCFLMDWFQP